MTATSNSTERKPIRLCDGIRDMTFDEVVNEFRELVFKLAHSEGRFMEWDDACQTALCGLWDAYKDYNRLNKLFGAFAKVVIRNVFYREWEKENRPIRRCPHMDYLDKQIPDMDGLCYKDAIPVLDNITELVDTIDINDIIERNFTPRQRVIIQSIINGYDQVEIGRSIGRHRASVAVYVREIKKTLREILHKKESAERADQEQLINLV